jgi:hypothetical protein
MTDLKVLTLELRNKILSDTAGRNLTMGFVIQDPLVPRMSVLVLARPVSTVGAVMHFVTTQN